MRELTSDIRPLWNATIVDVLREFIKICDKYGLRWYCGGGTALGAIRHKGIIPWDDDIDINMPRPDYDRFLQICSECDLGNYEIITPYNTPNYPLHFSKLSCKSTTLLEEDDKPCVIGLYIDIFPLDGTAADIDEAYGLMQRFQKLKNRLEAISTHNSFFNYIKLISRPKKWGRFVYKTIGFLCRNSYRCHLLKQMDSICRMYNYEDAERVILYSGGYEKRDIYPKEWFDGNVFFEFENIQVALPSSYDAYLSQLFGDYMTPPPPAERTQRHHKAWFDLDRRMTLDEVKDAIRHNG